MIAASKNWLFSRRLSEHRGLRGILVKLLRVFWLAAQEFRRDFCFERAATLSFATIISLIPLAVLLLGLAVQFGKGDELIDYLNTRVFPNLAPDFQSELRAWLDQNISRKAFERISVGIVGVTVLVGLIAAAMGALTAAERIFNRVWKVEGTRTYLQKAVTFWAILTLTPFLTAALVWIESLGWLLVPLAHNAVMLQGLYRFFLPIVVVLLGLMVLYRYLPEASVQMRSAALGAAVAAVLWGLSMAGFRVYVERSSGVTSLYGHLAIVPLFFVWIYLNWLIVLLGCEIAYAHQNLLLLSELIEHAVRGRKLPERYIAVYLLERLGRAYAQGCRLPEAGAVAGELGVLRRDVVEAARGLMDGGAIAEDASRPGVYCLVQEPRQIRLHEVLAMFPSSELEVQTETAPPAGARAALPACRALFEQGHGKFIEVFKGKTLADLLDGATAPDRAARR